MFQNKKTVTWTLFALGYVNSVTGAFAQSAQPTLKDILITDTAMGVDATTLSVTKAQTVTGAELEAKRASTLGDTLSNEVGIANTGFGSNAGRPVIRGLDGDRVKLLNNGSSVFDASATSVDHAVAINPILAERIEIIRGPAALKYGGNAVGGAINVQDGRTPIEVDPGVSGEVRLSGRFNARENNAAVKLNAAGSEPNQGLAIAADAFKQSSGDINIPGFARSAQAMNASAPRFEPPSNAEPAKRLQNSDSRQEGGSLGAAWRDSWGYVGLNTQTFRNNYGVGLYVEPNTRIAMQQQRQEAVGKLKLNGFIQAIEAKAMSSRYQHSELDLNQPQTTFKSNGNELRLEAFHRALAGLNGVIGLQASAFDFSAVDKNGSNSFLPNTTTRTQAVYVTETTRLTAVDITAGVRRDKVRVGADDSVQALGCAKGAQRDFDLNSGSLGAKVPLTAEHALLAQASHTERAPTYQELFACGEHAATLANEYGNRDLNKEMSNQLELGWTYQKEQISWKANVYRQQFNNYIGLLADPSSAGPTTDTGRGNRGGFDAGGFFQDYLYTPLKARFSGLELTHRRTLEPQSMGLPSWLKPGIELRADRIRTDDLTNNQPLPRIAPMRLGVSGLLSYPNGHARLDVNYAARQNRVAQDETPTDSYTLVNAYASYNVYRNAQGDTLEVFTRANNLFNQEARNSVSFLKDVLPMPGRTVTVGLRALF